MTCIFPRIGLTAYEEKNWIFVMVPNEKGRYLRTDKCVAYNPCPHCKATVGEPCFKFLNKDKRYCSATHYMRRKARKPQNYKCFKVKRNDDHDEPLD